MLLYNFKTFESHIVSWLRCKDGMGGVTISACVFSDTAVTPLIGVGKSDLVFHTRPKTPRQALARFEKIAETWFDQKF